MMFSRIAEKIQGEDLARQKGGDFREKAGRLHAFGFVFLVSFYSEALAMQHPENSRCTMKDQKMTYREAVRQLRIIKKMHSPYGDEAIDLAISTLKYFDYTIRKKKGENIEVI